MSVVARSVVPQIAGIAFGTVTHTTAATADTVITLGCDKRLIVITNNLDKQVMLTKSGADFLFLPALTGAVLDLGTDDLQFANGSVIGIYHLGVQPTVGNLYVTAM